MKDIKDTAAGTGIASALGEFLGRQPVPAGATRQPRLERVFVPGEGYQLVQPRPVQWLHVNGPRGAHGNVPYVRPVPKRLPAKARRRLAPPG